MNIRITLNSQQSYWMYICKHTNTQIQNMNLTKWRGHQRLRVDVMWSLWSLTCMWSPASTMRVALLARAKGMMVSHSMAWAASSSKIWVNNPVIIDITMTLLYNVLACINHKMSQSKCGIHSNNYFPACWKYNEKRCARDIPIDLNCEIKSTESLLHPAHLFLFQLTEHCIS